MTAGNTRDIVVYGLFAAISGAALLVGQGHAGEPEDEDESILDTSSYWRCLFVHSAPVVRMGQRIESLEPGGKRWSAPLAANWMKNGFSDESWGRRPGPFFWPPFGFTITGAGSPDLSLIRLRGYFQVKDLASAAGLTISVYYRGGLVLYLNGKELARGNLPSGAIRPDTLAEDYPLEAFFADDARKKGISWGYGEPEKFKSRLVKRIRSLEGVEIPVSMLRPASIREALPWQSRGRRLFTFRSN
jgi:hypothetical protein